MTVGELATAALGAQNGGRVTARQSSFLLCADVTQMC